LTVVPLLLGPQAAPSATCVSSWGTSSAVSSFARALAQATGYLGHDTSSITPGLVINVDGATPVSWGCLTTISEALTFEGSGGTVYTDTDVDVLPPPPLGSELLLQQTFGKLAPGIILNIDAINSDGLHGFLLLGAGSAASVKMVRSSISQAAAATAAVVWIGGIATVSSSLISEAEPGLHLGSGLSPGPRSLPPLWAWLAICPGRHLPAPPSRPLP
jgi:hypothetical protein